MSRKSMLSPELEDKVDQALVAFTQGQTDASEKLMLELIREASQDADRYFLYLYYGGFLLEKGKWDEARQFLIRSAQVALDRKDDLGLALSHEKLGDVSAAEEDWFSALHQYRYALRKGKASIDRVTKETLEAKAGAARDLIDTSVLPQEGELLSLSRQYLSGNTAISFVHRDIFLKNYFARCLDCNFCHDWCCSFGADIDIQNVEKIQQHSQEILPFIRPSQAAEWFETEYTYYEEYAGNQYTRIKPLGPRCVFISKDQRGCGLHRYALSKGMDYHEIKPLICILFPLSFEVGILSLASELDEGSLVCAGDGDSAYRSLRNELEYYFGHEVVEELDTIEKNVVGANAGS